MHASPVATALAAMLMVMTASSCSGPASNPVATQSAARYGANPAAGSTFEHDGVRFYFETYGQGEPLLLIHGNGGSIGDWAAQIAEFSKHYRVVAMDSRDHGRSGDSKGPLSYETIRPHCSIT
jgi:hypothetical protein